MCAWGFECRTGTGRIIQGIYYCAEGSVHCDVVMDAITYELTSRRAYYANRYDGVLEFNPSSMEPLSPFEPVNRIFH